MFSVLFSLAPLSVKSARFEHLYVVQYYWYILDTVWVYRICTCAPASVCYMCACMFTLSDIIPLYVSLCVYIFMCLYVKQHVLCMNCFGGVLFEHTCLRFVNLNLRG